MRRSQADHQNSVPSRFATGCRVTPCDAEGPATLLGQTSAICILSFQCSWQGCEAHEGASEQCSSLPGAIDEPTLRSRFYSLRSRSIHPLTLTSRLMSPNPIAVGGIPQVSRERLGCSAVRRSFSDVLTGEVTSKMGRTRTRTTRLRVALAAVLQSRPSHRGAIWMYAVRDSNCGLGHG